MAEIGTLVIGAGPLGASAARHLSLDPAAGPVVVVGPDHPADIATHQGLFGAWHDEARLTRVVADHDVWATLAAASIARYPQIAAEGGVPFHRTQGMIYLHERAADYQRQLAVAARHDVAVRIATPADYPYVQMRDGTQIIAEDGSAGTVNIRLLVHDQLVAACAHGARVVRDHVVSVDPGPHDILVRLAGGEELRADRVIVAAGAYVHSFDLLPVPAPVTVVGITALFYRVGDSAADALATMPGMLWYEDNDDHWVYLVPPTIYPDGNLWVKIGGYRESGHVANRDDIDSWHRTGGGRNEAAFYRGWMAEHIPLLAGADAHAVGCVITEAASALPVVREVAPRVVVATGCGGSAAKSCDELGRLAAVLSVHQQWDSPLRQELFSGDAAATDVG